MPESNITDEELLQMFIYNKSLLDEIRFLEGEEVPHQEKCINIGDAVFESIQDIKKAKLKEHQAGLIVKRPHISEESNQESEEISHSNQRLM